MERGPDQRRDPQPRGRTALLAVVGALPLIPILIGIAFTASGTAAPARSGLLRPLVSSTAPSAPAPPSLTSRPLLSAGGSVVAIVQRATELLSAPAGQEIAPQPTTTPFGSPAVLLVRQTRPGWFGVVTPLAGNGHLGWLPASAVALTEINWQLEVSLAHRRLTVLADGRVRERYTVAIGGPDAPTPTGDFAVTDRLRTGDPSGPYGCCILALSAVAPHAIQGWDGGTRIAIHSTLETSSIGGAVSHGCLRLTPAEGRWLIEHIPLGTPTIIRSS